MSITIQFELEKEVKRSVRFKEVVEEGKAPVNKFALFFAFSNALESA